MKKLAFLLLFLGILLSAHASPNQHTGPYGEINLGINHYSWYFFPFASDTRGFGWNAAAGYNFTSIFALEGGFMQNYLQGYTSNSDGSEIVRTNHINVPYTAMRFSAPIGERFALLGKLGVMAPNRAGQGKILPYVGIGMSYALTDKLDVTAQYQGAVYGFFNAGLVSGGLTYHFA